MDGYFCAFQESQGGATTRKSWLSPGKCANPQTERLSDKKKLRVKENDDVKVAFGFFYVSRE